MTHEKVDEMLKAYRFEVGRCGHLEIEISQLQKALDRSLKCLTEDAASIKSQQLSDMPKGTTVGSPTERIAIMLASGWLPEDIRKMQGELASLKDEYAQRYFTVLFVSSWLNGLTERERWIIEHQVIGGEYWKEVIGKFRIEFNEDTSKDSLKRLKQRALDKVYRMAE